MIKVNSILSDICFRKQSIIDIWWVFFRLYTYFFLASFVTNSHPNISVIKNEILNGALIRNRLSLN